MNPNNALWENGDFTRIATTMRETGEALVNSLGITKGLKVLDLGFGDGRVRAAVFSERRSPQIPRRGRLYAVAVVHVLGTEFWA